MRKRSVQISLLIAAIIISATAFLMISSNGKESNNQSVENSSAEPVTQQNVQPVTSATTTQKAGVYTDYSNVTLANASGTTLLFFHAPWCSQCRALDADIQKKGVPENTTILKVDYDSNQQLRQKYGVTIQTTIVKVDSQGNQIDKYVAYDSPTLQSVLDNLH